MPRRNPDSASSSTLAVCSWSLRPASPEQLIERVRACGLSHVQLALDPIRASGARGPWNLTHTRRLLRAAGMRVVSGMMAMVGEDYTSLSSIRRSGGVRPNRTWRANLANASENARIARALGLRLVTFHAGALPHGSSPRDQRERAEMTERTAAIAAAFARRGVRVALETGQEDADSLLRLLADVNAELPARAHVGVNFDPANMILYGVSKPIPALKALLPHVVQAHVKDATWTRRAGTWGMEVPAGTGEVDWPEFLETLRDAGRPIQLVIEREAGESRVRDVVAAARTIERSLPQRTGRSSARLSPAYVASPSLNIGILGLGFMGRTHLRVYDALTREREVLARRDGSVLVPRVLAVCDASPSQRTPAAARAGNIGPKASAAPAWDPALVAMYADPRELIGDPAIDAVSICTPTDTHVSFALAAIRAGKHVLLEKPAVVDPRDAEVLQREADRAGVVCMPAMCMRFWPGWTWLKRAIDERPFGRLTSLTLHRLGTKPAWSRESYQNAARTGGALLDLHIHDADLVLWMLGEPQSVSSVGGIDHVATQYRFAAKGRKKTRLGEPGHQELLVTAEGSWAHTPGWGFRMQYVATFERATAEFDFSRERPLMLSRDGRQMPVDIERGTGYDHEIPHFVDLVASGRNPARRAGPPEPREPRRRVGAPEPVVTLADAGRAARLIACERASISSGRIVRFS